MFIKKRIMIIFLILMIPVIVSLGARLRLIDGTEAKISIFQLTHEGAIIQAEGFFETIKLDADEIEYILFNEDNPSLLDNGGIVLTNGSVLYPKKFKIDVNEAVIETDSGVITCSLKEIASISYLFLNWFGEENVKGKIISTELSKDEKIKMMCLDNTYLVFSKLEIQDEGDVWLTSPAVDKNGTVYINDTKGWLYAINPDGTLKWKRLVSSWNASSPSIGKDGTIYVSSHDRKLYAINPDGKIIWTYTGTFDMHFSPSIAPDGTLYFGDSKGKFYAIDQNGKPKWTFQTEHEIWAAPAIAPDGTIYFSNFEGFLYALSKDGTLRWKAKICKMKFFQANYGPAIGSDETVYIGSFDGNLYAFNNKGNLKWKVNTLVWIISPPVVGPDDTIYFGTGNGEVWAISSNGRLKWKVQIGNSPIFSSAVVGNNRTIYIINQEGILCAIDETGVIKWKVKLDLNDVRTCLGYDGNGTLYVTGSPNLLYSIVVPSGALANSSWPKYKVNSQNTGLFGEK